jgi:hypothetical protein
VYGDRKVSRSVVTATETATPTMTRPGEAVPTVAAGPAAMALSPRLSSARGNAGDKADATKKEEE